MNTLHYKALSKNRITELIVIKRWLLFFIIALFFFHFFSYYVVCYQILKFAQPLIGTHIRRNIPRATGIDSVAVVL